ncbi:MAG TPA: hypothetical protein VFY20_04985 [Gemmatimonadales bacterium]|nr:hypothetical protein [Gemmatimonadales bacterium]
MRRTHLPLLALLASLMACSSSTDTTDALEPPSAPRLAAVRKNLIALDVTPSQVSVAAGATQQFAASGRRADGSTSAVTPTWSATGGSISSTGLYSAGTAGGTYRVVASSGNLSDTSVVTVTVTTTSVRTLTSLVLTPATAALVAGGIQQFAVAATWSDGTTTAPALTWSATGGSVSSGGLYTAGTTGGTFRVVAASGTHADTSSVTITVPTTTAPADFVNAPLSGWTTMASLTWSQPIPYRRDPIYETDNGTHLVDWGDDDPYREWGRQAAVVADASTPGTVPSSLELRLPAGLTGGYAATKIGNHPNWTGNGPLWWSPSLNTGYLYVGMWVRFSPGYTLNGNVGQKIFYLKSDLAANAKLNHMVGLMVNDGVGGNQLWPTYEPQNPYNRYKVPETFANNLNDGRWHQLEYLQLANTPGLANGTLKIWVDGRLEGTWTNAKFFDVGQVASVNRLEINPIYGGGTNAVPVNQWIRLGPVLVKSR